MKIQKIEVKGFGALKERSFDISGPLTLFYGNNEAGKSTIMGFIRSILFGFSSRTNLSERYEPVHGGIHGGALTLKNGQDQLVRVERYDGSFGGFQGGSTRKRGKSPSAGIVRVTQEGGMLGGEELLPPLLGGISVDLFRSLFAFSLSELQELRTLQSEEVSSFLYSTGWGAAGSTIIAAEKRLTQQIEQLYKPRGKNQEINETLKELEQIEQRLRQSREQVDQYNRWTLELEQLEQQMIAIETELLQYRNELDSIAKMVQAREDWERLEEIETHIKELPVFEHFPEDALSRFDLLEKENEEIQSKLDEMQLKLDGVEKSIQTLQFDEEVMVNHNELFDYHERINVYRDATQKKTELEAELNHWEHTIREQINLIDEDWSEETLQTFPISISYRDEVRLFRDQLANLQNEEDYQEKEMFRIKEEHNQVEQELAEKMREQHLLEQEQAHRFPWQWNKSVPAVIQEKEQVMADVEQWKQLKQAYIFELEKDQDRQKYEQLLQSSTQQGNQVNSTSMRLVLFSFALLTIGISGWLLWKGEQLLASSIFFLLLGFIGYSWFSQYKTTSSKQNKRIITQSEQQHSDENRQLLKQQINVLEKKLNDQIEHWGNTSQIAVGLDEEHNAMHEPFLFASKVESKHQSMEEKVDHWIKNMQEMINQWQWVQENAHKINVRIQELTKYKKKNSDQQARVEEKIVELEHKKMKINDQWSNWLKQAQLNLRFNPESVLEVLQLVDRGKHLLQQKNQIVVKLQAIQSQIDTFEKNVMQLLSLHEADDIIHALKAWKEKVEHQQKLRVEQSRLQERHKDLQEEELLWREKKVRIEERIRILWKEASAEEEEPFRKNARQHQDRTINIEEKNKLEYVLQTLFGQALFEAALKELKKYSSFEMKQRETNLSQQLKELEEQMNKRREEKGRLRNEIEKLELGEEHTERLYRLEEQITLLNEQVRRWGIYSYCSNLFKKAREIYEKERQPGVLQQASEYFSVMTGGQYTKVMTPIGDQRIFVQRKDGTTLETDVLSRGTAEQLYLAMRFSLAAEYARKAKLPLIMDDILVNFDRPRLLNAVKLLQKVSETNQILFFTCHPHVRDAFAEVLDPVQLIRI